jgi:hypothetical protein
MTIKPEIQERLGLDPNEGEDQVLVTIRPGGDGVSAQSAAETYVKKEYGVAHADILKVEYAGRSDTGGPIMLVTFKTNA